MNYHGYLDAAKALLTNIRTSLLDIIVVSGLVAVCIVLFLLLRFKDNTSPPRSENKKTLAHNNIFTKSGLGHPSTAVKSSIQSPTAPCASNFSLNSFLPNIIKSLNGFYGINKIYKYCESKGLIEECECSNITAWNEFNVANTNYNRFNGFIDIAKCIEHNDISVANEIKTMNNLKNNKANEFNGRTNISKQNAFYHDEASDAKFITVTNEFNGSNTFEGTIIIKKDVHSSSLDGRYIKSTELNIKNNGEKSQVLEEWPNTILSTEISARNTNPIESKKMSIITTRHPAKECHLISFPTTSLPTPVISPENEFPHNKFENEAVHHCLSQLNSMSSKLETTKSDMQSSMDAKIEIIRGEMREMMQHHDELAERLETFLGKESWFSAQ